MLFLLPTVGPADILWGGGGTSCAIGGGGGIEASGRREVEEEEEILSLPKLELRSNGLELSDLNRLGFDSFLEDSDLVRLKPRLDNELDRRFVFDFFF